MTCKQIYKNEEITPDSVIVTEILQNQNTGFFDVYVTHNGCDAVQMGVDTLDNAHIAASALADKLREIAE